MASGRGCGWPLNCFALPDGRPVWAGTYFPKDEWMRILTYFNELKQKDPAKLEEAAVQITEGIKSIDQIQPVSGKSEFTIDQLDEIAATFVEKMDMRLGGRTGAPKFPMPNGLGMLLRSNQISSNKVAETASLITLDRMADGGIYDQLGGGFARYSVDEKWLVPHFEKMLYDNGQLLSVYAEAYKLTANKRYKDVILQTIDFLSKELMSSDFGFYSSLDADSDGEEGKFYVWSANEINSVIEDPEEADFYKSYYNITDHGNWEEGKNILHITTSLSEVAKDHSLDLDQAEGLLNTINSKLFDVRSSRIRPWIRRQDPLWVERPCIKRSGRLL